MASRSVQPILHSTQQRVPLLDNELLLSRLKITLSYGASGFPSNTWFLGPTRVHNPNGISIGLAIFAGLIIVAYRLTNRPTDHTTLSVTTDSIYIMYYCDAG